MRDNARKIAKVLKIFFAAFAATVGFWSGTVTLMDRYGVELSGFPAWTAENAWWIFPSASLVVGIAIGYIAGGAVAESRKIAAQSEKERLDRESAERIAVRQAEEATRQEKIKAESALEVEKMRREADRETRERESAERKAEEEAARKSLLKKLTSLTDRQKWMLFEALRNGTVTLDGSHDNDALFMEAEGLITKLNSGKQLKATWKLSNAGRLGLEDGQASVSVANGHKRYSAQREKDELDKQQEMFRSLGFNAKTLVYLIYRDGPFDSCPWDVSDSDCDSGFLTEEEIAPDVSRYCIDPHYQKLFEERADECFAPVLEWLKEREEDPN